MDKKFFFQILGLVIVIFGALFVSYNYQLLNSFSTPTPNNANQLETKIIQIFDASSTSEVGVLKAEIVAEIADSKEERADGLSGRESLASDSGMLFVFDKTDIYRFWMKGMKFPLDFIWINEDRVVDILKNVPPPKEGQSDESLPLVSPTVPINKILEVNAGFADNHKLRVGDKIEIVE
ncbi:DUF192 domain-containing protein [Candidatus Daviesbacteria bacterium]|nr:DUF192 domain-containing protein [Candidatus Daviesbacteria bacterium]